VKVLVVDPSLFTLPYDQAFCRALAGAGAEVTLVGRPLRPGEALDGTGFSFLPLFYPRAERRPAGRSGTVLKGLEHALGLHRLARLVRMQRPDAVHLQWLVLPALDAPGYARIARLAPLVFTAHNSVVFHGGASPLQRLGYGRVLRRFAHCLVHTGQTADHLQKLGVPRGRVTVLAHPPLTLDAPPPPAASGDGRVRILLFGALKPYKGIDVLVRAGLELARRRDDFHITVAGRPFLALDGLEAEIAAAGARARFTFDARFLPEADLAAHLAAADIIVFPYREIDASGALALAAGQGKPIVASAVGVFAEPPVAERVWLVPPGDVDALAGALERLIATPAERAALGQAAAGLAQAMPGWPAFAGACLAIYRGLQHPAEAGPRGAAPGPA
jgi:glycosyltransferase involved in cell wall biosynthesis